MFTYLMKAVNFFLIKCPKILGSVKQYLFNNYFIYRIDFFIEFNNNARYKKWKILRCTYNR